MEQILNMNQQPTSGNDPLVEFIDVAVTKLSSAGATMVILYRISFTARQGEITGIIGASGSGKSTLIRLCNRLDDPSEGTILLNGQHIATINPLLLRRRIAMVLQKPFMFEGTLLENLQRPFMFRNIAPPSAKSDEITRVLDLVQLPAEMLERDARSLSGGNNKESIWLVRLSTIQKYFCLMSQPAPSTARQRHTWPAHSATSATTNIWPLLW